MVGLCESNFRKLFLGLNEILSTQTKIDKLAHFGKTNFFTHGSISPSILGLEKEYYIPNYCKLYEESA